METYLFRAKNKSGIVRLLTLESAIFKARTTVNSEIIAMFLSLLKMRQGYHCNNLNSHFEILYMN